MKIFKKIISAICAVSIVFSAVSVAAYADEMNGFTQEEIDACEVKPIITVESKVLTAEEAKANSYVKIPINVSGAEHKYASTGLHIYYDNRLTIAKNSLGILDVEKGDAINRLGTAIPQNDPSAAEMGMNGVFLTTASDHTLGEDGTMWTINFILPQTAMEGDVFPIDIVYRSNSKTSSMFSDVTNTKNGKLISAYTFTRGIYNGVTNNFVPDCDDVNRCSAIAALSPDVDGYIAIEDIADENAICGDANYDGTVDLADATSIIQHIGNEDKYALSAKGYANADANGDGIITGADAVIIQRIETGELKVSDLPLK